MSTTLNITRGDDYIIPLTLQLDTDGTLTPINLTGSSVYFTVKEKDIISDTDNTDTTATFQVIVTSHTDATHGITAIPITRVQTNLLKKSDKYVYDVQIIDTAGKHTTVIVPSPIVLTLDATRT